MDRQSEEAIKAALGPDAVFTRLGNILIVHLDHPAESTVRERIAEVQREAKEPADCPHCAQIRSTGSYAIVYQSDLPSPYSKSYISLLSG